MSYNNGLIYVDTSTTPNTGVSIGDLQRCFNTQIRATINNETVTRLSSDLGVICGKKQGDTFSDGGVTWTVFSRAEINKWAKWKPVVFNKVTQLTAANYVSANYGISNIPTWDSNGAFNKMVTFWLLENRADSINYPNCGNIPEYWKYTLPTGGNASPYRLTDFVNPDNYTQGYFHNAQAPFLPLTSTALTIGPNGQIIISYPHGAQDVRTLKLSDLTYDGGHQFSLSGFYFGVALKRKGAVSGESTYAAAILTATEALSNNGTVNVFFRDASAVNDFMHYTDQTIFYCMPFLANGQMVDTFSRTSGGTTTSYNTFLKSFNSLSADTFIALFERHEVTITLNKAKAIITNFYVYRTTVNQNRRVIANVGFYGSPGDINMSVRATVTLYTSPDSTSWRQIGTHYIDVSNLTGTVYSGSVEFTEGNPNGRNIIASGDAARTAYAVLDVEVTTQQHILTENTTTNTTNIHDGVPGPEI